MQNHEQMVCCSISLLVYWKKTNKNDQLLWMEEILHHLGWLKPYKQWHFAHQLVQDFAGPSTVSCGFLRLLVAPIPSLLTTSCRSTDGVVLRVS